jgi:hypothetical protein
MRVFYSFLLLGLFSCVGVLQGEDVLLLNRPVLNGAFSFPVSGTLQPEDSQYVHDVFCGGTGRHIGMVRMAWGYKYGQRYGGVGYVAEGPLEVDWHEGGVRVALLGEYAGIDQVVVVPRLAPIPK